MNSGNPHYEDFENVRFYSLKKCERCGNGHTGKVCPCVKKVKKTK